MGLFAKIAIIAEVAGVGSLNDLPPIDRPRRTNYIRDKLVNRTELLYKIIRVRNIVNWRNAPITWTNVTKAERDNIIAFYDSHEAQTIPFLWTPPDETTALLFHFSSIMQDIKISPNVYSVNVEIEQLTP